MFFGSRRRRHLAGGAPHLGLNTQDMPEPEACQWRAWRNAAQKVTRAWNAWLAADARERPELYRCYLSALAEEEGAATLIEQAMSAAPRARNSRVL